MALFDVLKKPLSPFADLRGDHSGMRVADLDAAVEWYADRAGTIEAPGQHHRLAGDLDQLMVWRGDTGLVGQPQRDLLPCLHALVVGLFRKLGDGEVSVLVDDRRIVTLLDIGRNSLDNMRDLRQQRSVPSIAQMLGHEVLSWCDGT